ncbi:hypothetical protein ACFV0C_35030 [Streptomyces sp. NPDC059568]|uniref:DUF7848 domain-containing protein n=1 Tax=Streptomyces sp. NPDC059568 TaxID=3346868 RepID=UPI0036CDA225
MANSQVYPSAALAVDEETSPPSKDFTKPQNWALRHCGQNPSHHTYRKIITRPWRA